MSFLTLQPISLPKNYKIPSWVVQTFAGESYRTFRVEGPTTLVRLLNSENKSIEGASSGLFWLEKSEFSKLQLSAKKAIEAERTKRKTANQSPMSNPDMAVSLHTRFQLRDNLAICGNWSDLNKFVSLSIPAGQSLIAFLGAAAAQPYYKFDPKKFGPDSKEARQQKKAEDGNIRLPGGLRQVVVDFRMAENQPLVNLISPPQWF